jgi:hypothetical protein
LNKWNLSLIFRNQGFFGDEGRRGFGYSKTVAEVLDVQREQSHIPFVWFFRDTPMPRGGPRANSGRPKTQALYLVGLKDRTEAAEFALSATGQEVARGGTPKPTKAKPKPHTHAQSDLPAAERRAIAGEVVPRRRQPIEIVLDAMWLAEKRGDEDRAVQLAVCVLPYCSPRLQAVAVRQANSLEDMPLEALQAFVRAGQMALKDPNYLAAVQRQAKLDAAEETPMTVEAAVTEVVAETVLNGAPEAAEADGADIQS